MNNNVTLVAKNMKAKYFQNDQWNAEHGDYH